MPRRPTYTPSRALALCGALSLAACEELHNPSQLDGGNEPGALQREGDHVQVSSGYRTCSADADCALVGTSCNGCCERDAISAALVAKFQQESEAACAGYTGGICDCAWQPLTARCEAGRCAARAPDHEPDASTPSQGDPCAQLSGSYQSVSELECGLGATGISLCHWSLTFSAQGSSWQHSDVVESGLFACKDGQISVAAFNAAPYTGVIAADGKLTFEGQAYVRKP